MSYPRPPPGMPINEAILQVDQQITLCLQRIDAQFAQAHEIIQGSILPKIKRYGEQSLTIGEASKFWRMFFETAAQVRLTQADDEMEGQEVDASQSVDDPEHAGFDPREDISHLDESGGIQPSGASKEGHSFDESLLVSPPGVGHHSPPRPSLGALKEDSNDIFFQRVTGSADQSDTNLLANATPRLDTNHVHHDHNMESPFAKAKRDLETQLASRQDGTNLFSSFNVGSSPSAPQLDSRLSTPRAVPTRSEKGNIQEDRIATPPQVTRESLDPSAMNKRRASLAAAAAANMTRNRFGAKVVATPMAGVPEGTKPTNPFTSLGSPSKRPLGVEGKGKDAGTPRAPDINPQWDGIADLRHTPIRAVGHAASTRAAGRRSASPPVTVQFSMPRSKWLKTPAKEAARQVVDDLLRTAERHGPSPNELIARRHAEYALAKENLSRSEAPLFSDDLVASGSGSGPGLGVREAVTNTTPSRRENARRSGLPTPPTVTTYPTLSGRTALRSSDQANQGHSRGSVGSDTSGPIKPATSHLLMDDGEDVAGRTSPPSGGRLARFAAQEFAPPAAPAPAPVPPAEDSDSDSDDDSDDSDESDGGLAPAGRPGATGPIGLGPTSNPTPSSASLLSSRSGMSDMSAVQALKDDTLFGSKLGANPFFFGGSGSNASNSHTGSANGSASRPVGSFVPRGNVSELGTFNMGRPLINEDLDLSSPLKNWHGRGGHSGQ